MLMATHNNFEIGKRYARADGKIVTIINRVAHVCQNGDRGGSVQADDGPELHAAYIAAGNVTTVAPTAFGWRWDDPNPGIGMVTGNNNLVTSGFALIPGAIPLGRVHSGPLKIR
jgi:hypothetical protein